MFGQNMKREEDQRFLRERVEDNTEKKGMQSQVLELMTHCNEYLWNKKEKKNWTARKINLN